MSTLQEKVNLAFHKASLKSSKPETNCKQEWLRQEWPELQKPKLPHLSQLKRQLSADEVKSLSIY